MVLGGKTVSYKRDTPVGLCGQTNASEKMQEASRIPCEAFTCPQKLGPALTFSVSRCTGDRGHPAFPPFPQRHRSRFTQCINWFQNSTPPQNRQLIVLIGNSKQYVDDFVGELTFSSHSNNTFCEVRSAVRNHTSQRG